MQRFVKQWQLLAGKVSTAFVPRLKFADMESLNAYLLTRCLELASKRQHPEKKGGQSCTFSNKKNVLHYVHWFHCSTVTYNAAAKCSSTCLVTFDRNRYSYEGHFIDQKRNIVLVGGTGTGNSHLGMAIASQAVLAI